MQIAHSPAPYGNMAAWNARNGRRIPPLRRRAVAAAELAILLPFLAFAFVAALDYCRVYYVTQLVQTSAHTAAQYACGMAKVSASI